MAKILILMCNFVKHQDMFSGKLSLLVLSLNYHQILFHSVVYCHCLCFQKFDEERGLGQTWFCRSS